MNQNFTSSTMTTFGWRKVAIVILLAAIGAAYFVTGREQSSKQETFPSAEDAVVAMVDAAKTSDRDKLAAIFGPQSSDLLSGDAVADQRAVDIFIAAYHERGTLAGDAKTKTLYVGSEQWSFPIPLVEEAGGWRFDTAAGIEELRYRRIGDNELATITTCAAYVAAQKEYAQKGHDGKPAGIYAQKFASEPGKHDGLYWKVDLGEEESPLGELAAEAAGEGYSRTSGERTPFRGYYFRILTAQGPAANGGAKSYLVDGEMRNGFALAAFPAEYGDSGVMTFVVGQDGIVYEKDLGADTAKLASEINGFNPDDTWQQVGTNVQ